MQPKKNRNYVIVFISVSLLCFFASTIFSVYKSKIFFAREYFSFTISSAAGLDARPAVSYRGIEIGRVSDFELIDDIKVSFFIYEEYLSYLSSNEVISLKRNPLTGGVVEIELVRIPSSVPVYPGGFEGNFLTLDDYELKGKLRNVIPSSNGGVDKLVAKVSLLLDIVEKTNLITKMNSALDITNRLGGEIDSYIEKNPENFSSKLNLIDSTMTGLGSLIEDLKKTNISLYKILNEVEKNKGQIGPMMSHGTSVVIKGEQVIEGLQENSLIKGFITPKKKDLKNGIFIE